MRRCHKLDTAHNPGVVLGSEGLMKPDGSRRLVVAGDTHGVHKAGNTRRDPGTDQRRCLRSRPDTHKQGKKASSP